MTIGGCYYCRETLEHCTVFVARTDSRVTVLYQDFHGHPRFAFKKVADELADGDIVSRHFNVEQYKTVDV